VNIGVHQGDITHTPKPVQAIITPINSGGMWFGGIDRAIMRTAGSQYHAQAQKSLGRIKQNDTIRATRKAVHDGHFTEVLFVIDDLESPLSDVIFASLKAAEEATYRMVAMSAMRTGVMLGSVEKTLRETVQQMRIGFDRFREAYPDSHLNVLIVVYSNTELVDLINELVL